MLAPVAFQPIGVIRTPFTDIEGIPIQAVAAIRSWLHRARSGACRGAHGSDGFSHLILIYHLDRMTGARLTVTPFLDTRSHGVFATRSPARPNPIGLSTVRLIGIDGPTLAIEDVDMLDGTPCST